MSAIKSLTTAAFAVALASTAAIAQSPAGNPSEPSTIENQQIGPSPARPSDPAAGSNPAARVPTAPVDSATPSSDGASSGEGGVGGYETPAGSPSAAYLMPDVAASYAIGPS